MECESRFYWERFHEAEELFLLFIEECKKQNEAIASLEEKLLAGTSTRLVHLSIDLVYSGIGDGGYIEHHDTDPVTVYGKTMVAAEQLILDQRPDSCILRISLPMGISFNGHAGAIDWIQHRFAKNKPATLYFDEVRTPTYVECLNEVAEEVTNDRLAAAIGLCQRVDHFNRVLTRTHR